MQLNVYAHITISWEDCILNENIILENIKCKIANSLDNGNGEYDADHLKMVVLIKDVFDWKEVANSKGMIKFNCCTPEDIL